MPTVSPSRANPLAFGEEPLASEGVATATVDATWRPTQPIIQRSRSGWRRSWAITMIIVVVLAVGSLTACGKKHPPKPANFSCPSNMQAKWSDKEKKWVCVYPSNSSSNGSSNGSSGKTKKK